MRSIVTDLLRKSPDVANMPDSDFVELCHDVALSKGYEKTELPRPWSILRERFAVKAQAAGRAKPRLSPRVANLVEKARQSALEAVACYNNPMSPFRSGGFIVNMHIAWTSLFLAVFYRNKTKPYYVDTASGKPLKIGDENKHWQLAKCAAVYWKGQDSPARENIRFFIGLRNKIEHALMPELDITIFGECQAHLINFENLLTLEFGAKYALQETLAMSLQFSALRDDSQRDAARKLQSALRPNIRNYVDKFRSSLSNEILSDMEFSHKVFLIPNVGNNRSPDALAVEFVKFDELDSEVAEEYERTVALIKGRNIPVANLDLLRAGEVAQRVAAAIAPKQFTASHHHATCWRYYKARPRKGASDPTNCNSKFCSYNKPHGDYLYTNAWVEFLISKMSDQETYERVMAAHAN